MFSDETRICLKLDSGQILIWRVPGNAARLRLAVPHYQQGGGSIMFWACIMHGRHTPLLPIKANITAELYCNQVLEGIAEPFQRQFGDRVMFQDDNARTHRARRVNDFLQRSHIRKIDWPACSPDMNPIEHAWGKLKVTIRRRNPSVQTVQDFLEAVVEEWNCLDQQNLDDLISSMPRRIGSLIQVRGGITVY